MARGAWQATVLGVAKSWIRLSTFFLSRVHVITTLFTTISGQGHTGQDCYVMWG